MLSYLRVEVLRMLRNRRYVIFAFVVPVGFYLLFQGLAGGKGGTATIRGADPRAWLMVSMAAYSAMLTGTFVGGARLAAERASGWTRQLRVTPLPAWGNLAAKVGAALALALPSLLLVGAAGVVVGDVHLEGGQWLQLLGMMWLGSLPFIALGLLVGYWLDTDTAQAVTVVSSMVLSVLGGIWIPTPTMPATMRQLAHALPSYHFGDLGWRTIAGQAPALNDGLILAAYAVVFAALAAWRYRRAGEAG
jgi:ABC-2 type transport system permease protein